MTDKKLQGKKNREKGRRFEAKVRADLESKGWIVDRGTNNVEFHIKKEKCGINQYGEKIDWEDRIGKLVPAKSNRFNLRTTGFPDYFCFKKLQDMGSTSRGYQIIGVEVKSNGYLDKEERAKCKWLLDNHIFSKILIASRGDKRGQIKYKEYDNKI